ncbi:MAG: outer membrane protein assembly factor BamA [Holophagaceae bacterium]
MTKLDAMFRRAGAGRVGRVLPPALVLLLAAGVPARAQESETIRKIEVVGAVKSTAETVIFRSGLKVGDDLRNVDLTAVLEKLWAVGLFDDIKFEVEDEPGGKRIVIRVAERPLIKEVDFRGGTEIGVTNLKDKVKEKKLEIKPDSPYDPEAARKIKALIVEQAAEKGFRNPVIDVKLEQTGSGTARLVFDIKEGGKVRIYKVVFRGNRVFSQGQLASAMQKTRKHWMFSWLTSHDLLVEKNLEEDLKLVKELYWRNGYKDVFVGTPVIDVADFTTARQKRRNEKRALKGLSAKYDTRATMTIPILEGERYFEGKLKVEGNEKLFNEAFFRTKIAEAKRDNRSWLAKFLNLKPSTKDLPDDQRRPFDLDALNKGLDKVKEAYADASYIAFRAEKKLEVRDDRGVKKVDVTVKADEGEPFTIRRITFEGNTTTKDKVLRRSMLLKEGDAFGASAFKDSYTGLGQLGFFDVKNQEPKVDFVADKPQVDVTIRGEESGVNELLFQGGYGSLFGFSLGLSFSTKNLGGGGEVLSFAYNGGKFQRNFSVGFTEPYVFDLPYSFGASVANGATEYDASRVGADLAYKQYTRSLGVSTGTRLSTFLPGRAAWTFFTSVGIGYNFSIVRIEGGRNFAFRDTSSQLTSTLTTNIAYSTVNHPFKPTSGTRLSLSLEYGGWQFATDKPFMRTTTEFATFGNIADRHIFAFNTSYGYLRNLGASDLPYYQYFRPGGENTIRGYRYGQVGSLILDNFGRAVVVGGNKQFIANVEYQFKVADQFRTVLFYDAGNAWGPGTRVFSQNSVEYQSTSGTLSFRNPVLLRSAGVELRFFLPISPAPLRLIWSRKLNPYPFDSEGRTDFQFSIGTTF